MKKKYLFIPLLLFFCLLISCEKKEGNNERENEPFDKNITSITLQDNNIWVGTRQNGLYKFDGESWIVYTYLDGLVSDTITAITACGNGNLWIGTNMGISKFENQSWTNYTESEGLFNNDIRCLDCDQLNNIWIGTRNNRVVKYDGNNFINYHLNSEASGPGELGHIHTITHDADGNIWAGSCISGLSKFDGSGWSDYVNNLGLFVESSICDPVGNIWIGHYTGAYKFSNNIWTNYSESDGLINNNVKCFAVDQQNNIWIGTDSGLSKYNGSSWTNYTINDGLLNDHITALACDKNGDIWIGSPVGLMKMTTE